MRFDQPLTLGTLLRRYKRFLADVRLEDGTELTAHIANTGPMTGCATPGSTIALSHHPNKGRKLPWSWELIKINQGWVGVNTARPNQVVADALERGAIEALRSYPNRRAEAPYGSSTRFDFLLSDEEQLCYVEVKSVTLAEGDHALFPDTVTTRGRKHLLELGRATEEGHRAVMIYLVNRTDCTKMSPADAIDPAYGETLREVMAQGVEAYAYQAEVSLDGIRLEKPLPVLL